MSVVDSLLVGAFGLSAVFLVLFGLSLLVRLQTALFARRRPGQAGAAAAEGAAPGENGAGNGSEAEPLRLYDVDEKTAAMVMAIVCDEMDAQPEELQFTSIRAMEKNGGR